jgi:hypothetical protein
MAPGYRAAPGARRVPAELHACPGAGRMGGPLKEVPVRAVVKTELVFWLIGGHNS